MSFRIDSLTYSYTENKRILNGIYLNIEQGDVVGILGRNGSGKTTLFNCLTVTNNYSGSLFFDSQYISFNNRSKYISYLPQVSFLPKEEKVKNIINAFPISKNSLRNITSDERILSFYNRKINVLSGGEKRYLEFLLINNLNQNVIILDEPFSEIEPIYETSICRRIEQDRINRHYIITDHKYHKILELCNKLYVLNKGVLILVENIKELYNLNYLS